MVVQPGPRVLREAVRQTERRIDLQNATRSELLEAAASMLRLSVATFGGAIALGGILVGVRLTASTVSAILLGGGVLLVVAASFTFAIVSTGRGRTRAMIVGPELRHLMANLTKREVDEATLLFSIAAEAPDWTDANQSTLDRLQELVGAGLFLLALGVAALLVAFSLIAGGHIVA